MILNKGNFKGLVNTLSRNEINNITIETTKNVREQQEIDKNQEISI